MRFPVYAPGLPSSWKRLANTSAELNRAELDLAADEMADVAFVAMGTLMELNSLGASACRKVADKNDNKTLHTHMVEPSSGKLVRRTQTQ